jgi:predicted RNA-binding protein with PUA-like domain
MTLQKQYWLVKSEPAAFSWQQMQADGITNWDGVRNYQAQNNLKAMRTGDLAFFYHSNHGKEIVGIVEVCEEFQPDPHDSSNRFGMVKMKYKRPLANSVSLKIIKETPALENIGLVKQGRLSVMPLSAAEWQAILQLAGEGDA